MTKETGSKSSLSERVADSIFWNAVLLPSQYLLSLISSIVVTSVLGTEGYGLLASLNSISSTINTYTDMGIAKSLPKFEHEVQKEYGDEGWNSLIVTLTIFKLTFTLFIAVLLNVFYPRVCSFFEVSTYQRLTIGIVSIALILQAVSDILTGVLVSEFKNKAYNLSRLVTSLVTPLVTIVVGLLGGGVLPILSVGIATRLVQVVTLWMGMQRSIQIPSIRWFPVLRERVFLWRFAKFSASTYTVILARYFLSLPFAILMLNFFGLQDQVAYLALGGELVKRARSFVTMPLTYIIGPLLGSTFLDKTYARLRRAYRTMIKIYQLLTVPSSLGIVFVASFIVKTLYGTEFVNAIAVLQILGLTMASPIIAVSVSILQTYERYRWMLLTIILGIAGSVVGMAFFVPAYAEIGAALALILGSLLFYGASTVIAHFEFSLSYPTHFLIKILISCTPMLIYFPLATQIEQKIPIAIAYIGFSALAFWSLFKLQGGLDEDERRYLARVNMPFKGLVLKMLG